MNLIDISQKLFLLIIQGAQYHQRDQNALLPYRHGNQVATDALLLCLLSIVKLKIYFTHIWKIFQFKKIIKFINLLAREARQNLKGGVWGFYSKGGGGENFTPPLVQRGGNGDFLVFRGGNTLPCRYMAARLSKVKFFQI